MPQEGPWRRLPRVPRGLLGPNMAIWEAQRGPGWLWGAQMAIYGPVDVGYRAPGGPLGTSMPRRPPEPPGIQGLRGAP